MSETEKLSFCYPEWKHTKPSRPWWWAAADQVSWVVTVQFVKGFKDPVALGVCVKTPSSSASTGATDKIIMNIKAVQRFILTAAGIFPKPKFMVSFFFIWYLFYFIFPVGCIVYLLMIYFSRRMQSFNWVLQPLMWSYQQDNRIFLLVPGGAHSCQVWYLQL